MKVAIKGKKIILSETPGQDVAGAFFLIYNLKEPKQNSVMLLNKKEEFKQSVHQTFLDVKKGQKEYNLPEGVFKKDIEALYLRVI